MKASRGPYTVHQKPMKVSFGSLLLHPLGSERGPFLGPFSILAVAMRAVIMEDPLSRRNGVRLIAVRVLLVAIAFRNLIHPRSVAGRGNRKRRKQEQYKSQSAISS